MFEDWEGLRDGVRAAVPGGEQVVAAVDAIAEGCSSDPLSNHDLVRGNFNLANTLTTEDRLWLVDCEGLSVGPRVYDLAEVLLVAAASGHAARSAEAKLWEHLGGLDRREFAICAGSIGLTMADSYVRKERPAEAGDAVPAVMRTLERAAALAGGGPR